MDHLSAEKRKWNMQQIKSKNTSPELKVRKYFYSKGFRYRIHRKDLPGKPDISNKQNKIAIFVNGCFWHRHENCKYASTPKTNTEYWTKKFERNIKRDKENHKDLEDLGFTILVIWECEVKNGNYINIIDNFLSKNPSCVSCVSISDQ